MTNVRSIIKRRMKELDMGPYDLAKAVRGKVSAPTVYNFVLRGSAMNSKSIGYVIDALKLELKPKG